MMAGSKNVGTRLGWREGCVGRDYGRPQTDAGVSTHVIQY